MKKKNHFQHEISKYTLSSKPMNKVPFPSSESRLLSDPSIGLGLFLPRGIKPFEVDGGDTGMIEKHQAGVQQLLAYNAFGKKTTGGRNDGLADLDEAALLSQTFLNLHVLHQDHLGIPAEAFEC